MIETLEDKKNYILFGLSFLAISTAYLIILIFFLLPIIILFNIKLRINIKNANE